MIGFIGRWRLRRWKRRYKGFTTSAVVIGDAHYNVRELTVAERVSFREYVAENDNSAVLAVCWLAHTACLEFSRTSVVNMASDGAPTAIARVSTAVLELSGMATDDDEQPEGELRPFNEDDTAPGTVADAKKNCAATVS